jgi:signal peptidase I
MNGGLVKPDTSSGIMSELVPPSGPAPNEGSRITRALMQVLRGLILVVVPALLAALCARYLVPTPSEAEGPFDSLLASVGSDYPIPFAVGLFLFFSLVFRYWRFHLPGVTSVAIENSSSLPSTRSAIERRRTAAALTAAAASGLLAFLLRSHVVTPYRVLSTSMLPTLLPGDFIAASRLAYGMTVPWREPPLGSKLPSRGDIVVFRNPESDDAQPPVIKRVIGLPGDHVAMQGSRAVINGWEVPTCDAGLYLFVLPDGAAKARLLVEFLDDHAYLTIAAPPPREFPQPYEVKPGEVFVLGDNRNNSSDSRAWDGGRGAGLPLEEIEGAARWFLVGRRRDERVDLSRMLQSVGGTQLKLEGLDDAELREGIAKCLEQWPKDTRVPPPRPEAPAPLPQPAKVIGD